MRLSTHQVKLRGNRRGLASRMKLAISTAQRYHGPAISQHRKIIPLQCHILMVQGFCEPCAWQAELTRLGLAPVKPQIFAACSHAAEALVLRLRLDLVSSSFLFF